MKRTRGMTLVELMVTLTILAMLLAAAIPSIGSWIRSTQIRNTAESILTGIQRARTEALKRNRSTQFSLVSVSDPSRIDNSCALSSTSGSWVVSLANPTGKCGAGVSDTVDPFIVDSHPVADGGRNVSITALKADGTAANTITFDAFGRVTSASPIVRIDITMASGGADIRPLSVEISSSGSVRTCDPQVSSTSDPRHCQIPRS